MPPMLANVNPQAVYNILRDAMSEVDNIEEYKFSTLVSLLEKRIQRARYEQFLLQLASVWVHEIPTCIPGLPGSYLPYRFLALSCAEI